MDFRILGPLEVWDGGRRVPVKGRLHPKVLAGLSLNNGRTVSLDWIVDLLWDGEPPATARRQAQNAVAALRRQLGDVEGGLVRRVGQGYRIDVPDAALDLRRFEAGARDGRRLMDDDRHLDALGAFDKALNQWRGPALAGLTGRVLEAAAARLNDARLSAIEDRAQVATGLGHTDEVIAELRDLVEEHPLRQRLTARLMTALGQQGERSQALRLFENLRNRLTAELGLDPSPELVDVHARILRREPGPQRRVPVPVSKTAPTWPAPAQLPADISTFAGRVEQLATLDRLLDTGSRVGVVSAVTGIGGVGKTALAVRWSHARKESFPDGQLYVNLRGFDGHEPLPPYEAVVRLLRVLEGSATDVPPTLEEASARYRSVLAERRVLIVLDNARSAGQVRPLLPGGSGSLVLVTSRNRLSELIALENAHPIELDTLSPVESVDLLISLIGPDALRDEAGTRSIADSCAHLPLALRIAAARLTQDPHMTIAGLAAELTTASRLRMLRLGDDPYANVATVFEHSHAALGVDARTLFTHLALIPGNDFSRGLAVAISRIAEPRVDQALESLVQAQLLEQRGPLRYGFHDLIRLYAEKRADSGISEPDRADAVDRMIDWYHSHRNDARQPEFDNLIAALRVHERHPRVTKLAMALQAFGDHAHDLRAIREHLTSALHTAENRNDTESRIQLLSALGSTYSAEGDSGSAIRLFRRAVAMLSDIDDPSLTGTTVGNLGSVLYGAGSYAEAEECLLRAIRVAEETGNLNHLRTRLANLGRTYRGMARYAEAEDLLSRALKIAEDTSSIGNANHCRLSLSKLHVDMGRLESANAEAHRVLEVSRRLQASRVEIEALLILGEVAGRTRNTAAAAEHLRRAAELAEHNGRFGYELEAHCLLARTFADARDHDEAHRHLDLAWGLKQRTPQTATEANLSLTSCKVHAMARRFEQAVDSGERAVMLYRGNKGLLRLGRSLEYLGDAHRGLADLGQALECWTEALDIFTRLGVPEAGQVAAKLRDRVH